MKRKMEQRDASSEEDARSSSESEQEQEPQQQESDDEEEEEAESEAEADEADENKEEEAGSSSESEEEAAPAEQSSDSEESEAGAEVEEDTPVVQTQETSSSSDSEEEEEEDAEKEATPVVQSEQESSDDSGSEEEEATPPAQKQASPSRSESEEDDEEQTTPVEQNKQESSGNSDSEEEQEQEQEAAPVTHEASSDSEEEGQEPVVQSERESSDGSDLEVEEETTPVESKKRPARDINEENDQRVTPVDQSNNDRSDSFGNDEDQVDEEQSQHRVKTTEEGPQKKKAKTEQKPKKEVVTLKNEDSRAKTVLRLLEPLSKESLLELIVNAATQYDVLYAHLQDTIGSDVSYRKVLVHGLSLETEVGKLRQQFQTFGKIEDAGIVHDKTSGKARGFGYVTFADSGAAQRTIQNRKNPIVVDGRTVSCHLAIAKSGPEGKTCFEHQLPTHDPLMFMPRGPRGFPGPMMDVPAPGQWFPPTQMQQPLESPPPQLHHHRAPERTVLVRSLSNKTTKDGLRKGFKKFGEVESTFVMWDRSTNTSKCFGSVIFREKAGADNALKAPKITLDGIDIVYLRATNPKSAASNEDRTLFVRSLSKNTTENTLRKEFKKFGEVEDAFVMWDRSTNESKCFGSVTFREKAGLDNAMKIPKITLDGNEIVHVPATDGKKGAREAPDRTIFVGSLSKQTTSEALQKEFKKFGEVENANVVLDRATNESKCYGFVTFREKAGADNALKSPQITLDGNALLCKRRMQNDPGSKGPIHGFGMHMGPMPPFPGMPQMQPRPFRHFPPPHGFRGPDPFFRPPFKKYRPRK